jgi:hypothetical protein
MSRYYSRSTDEVERVPLSSSHEPLDRQSHYLNQQSTHQPENAFERLRAARQYSRKTSARGRPSYEYSSSPPPPPPHRDVPGRIWGDHLGYINYSAPQSLTTPGADNFGDQAAGGIAGIAIGVADANQRQSGVNAMRYTPGYDIRDGPQYEMAEERPSLPREHVSETSLTPLETAAMAPGISAPEPSRSSVNYSAASPPISSRSPVSYMGEPYTDSPNHRYSRNIDPSLVEEFDPETIDDDGDYGLYYGRKSNRNSLIGSARGSMLSLGTHSNSSMAAGLALSGANATGPVSGNRSRATSSAGVSTYAPVSTAVQPDPLDENYDLVAEKAEWEKEERKSNKKKMWIMTGVVAILIVGGIIGGIIGGVKPKLAGSKSSSSDTASTDTTKNGVLNKNSQEIQALMNNSALHKVFPGMDYTPLNTQYPDCLSKLLRMTIKEHY